MNQASPKQAKGFHHRHGSAREPVRVAIVGDVGHGKSTLVGCLLHDTGMLPKGKLKPKRDQGDTIGAVQIRLRTGEREYVLIDAPDQRELIDNMVTGAANADAALLLIDANQAGGGQSHHHGFLLQLLGVHQVAVAINKMDLIGYDETRFRAVEAECRRDLESLGVTPTCIIPISAREGDNVAQPSDNLAWHGGPTALEALAGFAPPAALDDAPLRLPLHGVHESAERRIFAGRLESGRLKIGDRLLFSPSNRTARVASIEVSGAAAPLTSVGAGASVEFTLDEQSQVERGEVASHLDDPPIETDVFHVRLLWLAEQPLKAGDTTTLLIGPASVRATVERIERVIGVDAPRNHTSDGIVRDEIADIVVRTDRLVAIDPHEALPRTGRVVFARDGETLGGGIVSMGLYPDQRNMVTVRATNVRNEAHRVTTAQRFARNQHRPGVLWFTGLSGAGKSTLAMALEQRLFDQGYQVYVLDGDNVRRGLNANLGFSPEDRAENIRRVGEVAALLADAGVIVITAFISPYRSDRERARAAAGDSFHEIYIHADLATCEARDPKGLYQRARRGEISDFTGVDAPYEAPDAPELVIETATESIDACIDRLVAYVAENFRRTG